MAYCGKCGTKLNDGAKFCPKCGNRVGGNDRGTPIKKEKNPNQEGLSTWERIALGVAGLVAFTGICGGFADGMWIVALLSLCALGAVCAAFMGIIEKKYVWTIALCSFFVITMAIGLSANEDKKTESKQSQPPTEQKQKTETTREKSKQVTKKEDSIVGTYEITDKVGCTIHITLNEDKTATITGVRGEGVTYYCKWDDFRRGYGGIRVWYGSTEKTPYLVFDGGDNVKKNMYNPGGFLKDGWFYVNLDEAESKDPNWRLKATKIK